MTPELTIACILLLLYGICQTILAHLHKREARVWKHFCFQASDGWKTAIDLASSQYDYFMRIQPVERIDGHLILDKWAKSK